VITSNDVLVLSSGRGRRAVAPAFGQEQTSHVLLSKAILGELTVSLSESNSQRGHCMSQPWVQLLRHQQRRHRLALTFPFLLGALRQPIGAPFESEQEARAALVSLLTCFQNEAPDLSTTRIYTCPDLGQPVASIKTVSYHPSYARWGMSKPELEPLDVDPPYRPAQTPNVSVLAQLLWPHISEPVSESRFSYSRALKSYLHFDQSDLDFIAAALTYDEENEL
jgi:hypothetical protein